MLQGPDFQLAVSILKSNILPQSIVQDAETAVARGQASDLKSWLIENGHMTEEDVTRLQGAVAMSRRTVRRADDAHASEDIPVAEAIPAAPSVRSAVILPDPASASASGEGEADGPHPEGIAGAQVAREISGHTATPSQTTRPPEAPASSGTPAQDPPSQQVHDPVPSEQAPVRAPRQAIGRTHQDDLPSDPDSGVLIDGTEHVPRHVAKRQRGGIQEMLIQARQAGASDLHIVAGAPLIARIHGRLTTLSDHVFTAEDTDALIRHTLLPEQLRHFREMGDLDFAYAFEGGGRFRANAVKQRRGVDLCFRIIHARVPTLDELHLPAKLIKFTEYPQGLVLITGPAGCGKSTTMAALVDLVNSNRHEHLITIEDPIEFVIEPKQCQVTQRQLGLHTQSFSDALKGALRQDPDIIVIGELRDVETAEMAIHAAETGHLVFSSMHTNNATQTITRLLDLFPPGQQGQIRSMVSESLRGIVSQILIPDAAGEGMVPACEVLFNNAGIGNLIRENKTDQILSAMQVGQSAGHQTLDDALHGLLEKKLISRETAHQHAIAKAEFGGAHAGN